MRFERFDRDEVAVQREVSAGPVVRVDVVGRVLFNPQAWEFLAMQITPGALCEVALLFDAETRTLAVQPVVDHQEVPDGARWVARQMRSTTWPRGVNARPFVEYHQVAAGEYLAGLLRGPGPRMVTCAVGAPRPLPAGVMPGSLVDEEPLEGAGR